MDMSGLIEIGTINYIIMALVIGSAAFLQGVGGIGFAMVAAPIAAFFVPEMVPGALLVLGGSVSFLASLREREEIVFPVVGIAVLGRTIGTAVAAVGMTQLPANYLGLLFGVFILLAVLLSASGIRVQPSVGNVSILGIISGIMGTLTSVGAPSLAIAMQALKPAQFRATLGMTLFFGAAFSIVSLAIAGLFTTRDLVLAIALWPFMYLGFRLSNKLRYKISAKVLRHFLLLFCGLSGAGLIIKALI